MSKNTSTAAEIRRFLRESPPVGAVDSLGYVVCLACASSRPTRSPVKYGATYSTTPCECCGKPLTPPQT